MLAYSPGLHEELMLQSRINWKLMTGSPPSASVVSFSILAMVQSGAGRGMSTLEMFEQKSNVSPETASGFRLKCRNITRTQDHDSSTMRRANWNRFCCLYPKACSRPKQCYTFNSPEGNRIHYRIIILIICKAGNDLRL